jgi:hypothetical protein
MNTGGEIKDGCLHIDHAYILSEETLKRLLSENPATVNITIDGSVFADEGALAELEKKLKAVRNLRSCCV